MVAKQKKEALPEKDERGYLRHLADLKKSYQKTLGQLQKRRKEIEDAIEAAPTSEAKKEIAANYEEELEHIKGMISDVNYCIEWLHTGRQPNARRGIDRRSVYQRTVFMDPSIMERYVRPVNSRSASTLTEDEQHRLREVLEILSPREREAYELAYGQLFSHEQIAKMLKIPKGAVDTMIKRAHEKVSRGWQGTLF